MVFHSPWLSFSGTRGKVHNQALYKSSIRNDIIQMCALFMSYGGFYFFTIFDSTNVCMYLCIVYICSYFMLFM